MSDGAPFRMEDYTLTHRATGLRALNRRELQERVRRAPPDSLFLHFWGPLTVPGREAGEYGNDLAQWAATRLHDLVLAERLALIDPRLHPDVEALRRGVLEVVEERLEEPGAPAVEAEPADAFHFLVAHVVVYDAGVALRTPGELAALLPELTPTALLRHFVDAPGSPVHAGTSLRGWLRRRGGPAAELADGLRTVATTARDAARLRERVAEVVEATLGSTAGEGRAA